MTDLAGSLVRNSRPLGRPQKRPDDPTLLGEGANGSSARRQVTLCDPIWHVSSRSGEAMQDSRTAMSTCAVRHTNSKDKGSPCSNTEPRVPELIPVLESQPAGDVSHKPGGRLSLLSARPATLKSAATNFAAW